MRLPAQQQLDLSAKDPSICPCCGRRWPGIFVAEGMHLGLALELDAETFRAVSRCWIGACRKANP